MIDNGRRHALVAGAVYFALTFGAGFCLAFIRIPFLEPRLGARWAELVEMPFMLVAIVLACRWTVRRFAIPPAAGARLVMGFSALAFMLAAEFGLVLALRGITIAQYFATRDPVSGTVYYLSLLLFAVLPRLQGRSPRQG
jgi:hypothetical protein